MRLRRPPAFVLAATALACAVAFIAALTYYGALEFSGRAADGRAANEAMSFAEHSSRLATGDAFDGYIQILRYADDPILNAKSSPANARASALQRWLYVNVNKFTSLTIVDRAGLILASTDSTLSTVKDGTTFSETRANLAPANSDIILPEAGRHGYVEYSAPLRDPDGTVWGILLGRADPATLWKGTLAASVDGGRNVIINSEGQFSAGVPDELLRQPWHGRPLGNGGVRADIAGVDSICGLAPIGKDTQIDRGLNVASCLPASLIQVERSAATNKQALITIAGAMLAIVVAAALLKLLMRDESPENAPRAAELDAIEPASTATPSLVDVFGGGAGPLEGASADAGLGAIATDERADDELKNAVDAASAVDTAGMEEPHTPTAAPVPPPPDIDALTLIDAYEQRNARLAVRLRETIQAKLLLTASEVDQAFKLVDTDAEAALGMHEHAMAELEHIRTRELRSIGQEMFPGLTRLGLPGALRALRKELDGGINVTLDLDATTDSVAGGASRSSVSPALRLVMYRFALESARALAVAGADECLISLRRDGDRLVLAISCGAPEVEVAFDRGVLAPSQLAAEAHAGAMTVSDDDGRLTIALSVPAADVEPGPEVYLDDDDIEVEDDAALVRSVRLEDAEGAADLDLETEPDDDAAAALPTATVGVVLEPRTGLAAAMEALQAEFFGSMIVALDIGEDIDAGTDAVTAQACEVVEDVARETLRALQAADARQCDLSLTRAGAQLMLSILSEVGDAPFDGTHINAYHDALVHYGGYLAVDVEGGNVAVSAEVSTSGQAAADDDAAPIDATAADHGTQHAA